jgi:hypothetical protein
MSGPAPVPNVAVVMPGADGTICVTPSIASHIVVDRFVSFSGGHSLTDLEPDRIRDTRDDGGARLAAGGSLRLDAAELGVTPDTTGVMLNLTATLATAPGFLAAYPCADGRPETSNLNYVPGATVANFVLVEPDAEGDVCIFSPAPAHVVVDLLGRVGAGFTGGVPERLLDTRIARLPTNWP